MDPFTIAMVIMAALGAGTSAYAQKSAADTQKKMLDRQAEDAKIAADAQKTADKLKAQKVREQGEKLKARQRVAYAKSGVVGNVGTPLLVQTEAARAVEEEAMLVSREGDLAAISGRTRADLLRWQGGVASRAGAWKAGSTALSGFSAAGSLLRDSSGKKYDEVVN